MTNKAEETAKVLDQMAVGILGKKREKGTKLTPVGVERPSPLPKTPQPFPNDQPHEVVAAAVKAIRREVGYIIAALDAIDATNGVPEPPVDLTATERDAEREADEKHVALAEEQRKRFDQKFKAMQEDAQRATFVPEPVEPGSVGWECPNHGTTDLVSTTSRKGRTYRVCKLCMEFEK